MDLSAAAQLKTLLTGVGLPADKAALLVYAVRQHAEPRQIAAIRSLPEREYASLDEVTEELLHVQPRHDDTLPNPREKSGARPGGADYTAGA
jgi:uncharacterized protein DUF2795